jgi:hypothetical protein
MVVIVVIVAMMVTINDGSGDLLPRQPELVTQLVQRSSRGEEVTAVNFSYLYRWLPLHIRCP